VFPIVRVRPYWKPTSCVGFALPHDCGFRVFSGVSLNFVIFLVDFGGFSFLDFPPCVFRRAFLTDRRGPPCGLVVSVPPPLSFFPSFLFFPPSPPRFLFFLRVAIGPKSPLKGGRPPNFSLVTLLSPPFSVPFPATPHHSPTPSHPTNPPSSESPAVGFIAARLKLVHFHRLPLSPSLASPSNPRLPSSWSPHACTLCEEGFFRPFGTPPLLVPVSSPLFFFC